MGLHGADPRLSGDLRGTRREEQADHGGGIRVEWASDRRSRSQRLIRMLRMPAEASLIRLASDLDRSKSKS